MTKAEQRIQRTRGRAIFAAPVGLVLVLVSAAQAATLADLDFLDGHWLAMPRDQRIEEIWLPASGSTKTAMFRWTQADRTITIELVIVAAIEDRVELRFKHYTARFEPWEKDQPNTYELVEAGDHRAVFRRTSANTKVPAWMIYARDGDTLRFRGTADVDAPESGDDLVLTFTLAGAARDTTSQ